MVQEGANGVEVGLRRLDVAHVPAIRDDDELAPGDALVEYPGCPRRGRAVVLADDHERRPGDTRELRAVVEVPVAGVREVAQHVRRVDSAGGEPGRRRVMEVERQLVLEE